MDEEEFAALQQKLLDALIEADRADGTVRDLAHAHRVEKDRRRGHSVPDEEPDDATILELRPNGDDDPELTALRAAHRDWHIWRNSEGWHAVKNAHSDPITEPTAADLDRRLGPDAT